MRQNMLGNTLAMIGDRNVHEGGIFFNCNFNCSLGSWCIFVTINGVRNEVDNNLKESGFVAKEMVFKFRFESDDY